MATLTALTIGGGLTSLLYSFQTNSFFKAAIDKNLAALEAADSLETALVMQKGFLTYFFQDNNVRWLKELESHHHGFKSWLGKCRKWAETDEEQKILDRIEAEYLHLTVLRERVIDLYKSGNRQNGFAGHQKARLVFLEILKLAQRFRGIHELRIDQARAEISTRARYMSGLALVVMPLATILSVLLVLILVRQILGPIRRLAEVTASGDTPRTALDEVQALSHGVQSLRADVDQTKSELELSRMHLVQATKMASVGRLAASVAHTIRNPLTAVKMRLFSLQQSVVLTKTQKEDFAVISGEIRHIDNILRNFLEFSRRPKLAIQRISPSDIVDTALELVRPRMESYGIDLELNRNSRLPKIEADPDQLKEALVNLLINASDAVGRNGRIIVEEDLDPASAVGRAVVIRITDNGPGVSHALREEIFQPFFSTKVEGTGLGLSIARRIVEEHGGRLKLRSPSPDGAAFIIILPARETWAWTKS